MLVYVCAATHLHFTNCFLFVVVVGWGGGGGGVWGEDSNWKNTKSLL